MAGASYIAGQVLTMQRALCGMVRLRCVAHRNRAGLRIGYNFVAGGVPIHVNLRGCFDLETKNRLGGESSFVTVSPQISALMQRK